MAVIIKKEITKRIKEGSIAFTPPLDSFQLQDHSVDLRLGFTFLIPKIWRLTPSGREALDVTHFDKLNSDYFEVVELEQGQHFDLLPSEYVLVSTLESLKVPSDLMAVLYPRSSINRKGLSLDLTGIIDSGYEGQLSLPIRNNTRSQPIRLYPGERICQVVFETLSEAIAPTKSKYHKRDIVEGVKLEKKTEAQYILKGDIRKLKNDFPLS